MKNWRFHLGTWALALFFSLSYMDLQNASAETCVAWKQVQVIPQGVSDMCMAYDTARGVIVRFGGSRVSAPSVAGETFEWEVGQWVLKGTSGPSKRASCAMTYDPVRNRTVMFGGDDSSGANLGVMGDTWEWNGAAWTLRSTTGPPARAGARMVYDSVRNVTVLFGGRDSGGSAQAGTWTWDGTGWTNHNVSAPPPRSYHGMAFDSARGVVVVVGGFVGPPSGLTDDTWEWNGASWSLRSTTGAPPRYNVSMAYDAGRGRTVLFGGNGDDQSFYGDTWEWDGSVWIQVGDGTIPPRSGHAMVYDPNLQSVVVSGGFNELYFSDIWRFDGATWIPMSDIGPAVREAHAMCFDRNRGVTVLNGGNDGLAASDTWEWDGTQWLFRDGSFGFTHHAMAFDTVRGVCVAVGNGAYTYEWDGTSWSHRTDFGPGGGQGHYGMAYDTWRDVTVLTNIDAETWEWNGVTWTQRLEPGPGQFIHYLAFDELRGVSVLHTSNSTWEWDGVAWNGPLATGAASPGGARAVVFDSSRNVVLMIQGYGDTWDWDGTTWTFRGRTASLTNFALSMAFDTIRGVAVVNTFGETWESCTLDCADTVAPAAQALVHAPCTCYATTNRYLSFVPPGSLACDQKTALRVTFGPMPGPGNCPEIPDFSAFDGQQMWVGTEVLDGAGLATGVYRLQTTPLFRDWSAVAGGVVHVSDCNIVPCATYTLEATTEIGLGSNSFSPPLVLSTTPTWGDVVGPGGAPADGLVNGLDIVAVIDRFKQVSGVRPATWCDLYGNQPNLVIDGLDITLAVDAFKGLDYPFPGPTAPNACP